jgi:hypothetical protein
VSALKAMAWTVQRKLTITVHHVLFWIKVIYLLDEGWVWSCPRSWELVLRASSPGEEDVFLHWSFH